MTQLAIFPGGPTHRRADHPTSIDASKIPRHTDRALVLDAHQQHPGGLTDFELAELLGRQQTSVGKRRGELVNAGLIIATTRRRKSPSGSPAIVWQITPAGRSTHLEGEK